MLEVVGNKFRYTSALKDSLETVEAGDFALSTKFGPKLKFNCFHPDELCWGSFNLNMTGNLSATKSGDGLSFGNANYSIQWLPTGVKEGFNQRGGIDWIIRLLKKPSINYLNFDFDSFRLVAYHQGELTPNGGTDKSGKAWVARPDYVVNSIAFYHASKGLCVTQSDVDRFITTGKAFHLYRMSVVDAKGVKTWANWTVESASQVRLSIDSAFLNTATYPVVIQPFGDTFGYTSTGGSKDLDGADHVEAGSFAVAVGGDLTKISGQIWHNSGTSSLNSAAGIYNTSLARLAYSSTSSTTGGEGAVLHERTVTYTFAAATYWLAFYQNDDTYPSSTGVMYDASGTSRVQSTTSLPATLAGSTGTHKYSIWGTYTPGGAAYIPRHSYYPHILAH